MKNRYLFILMLMPTLFFGQKASPQLLSNAGNITETSEVKVSWTLGEFAIATLGQNPKLTQGMQQSKIDIETKVTDPEYLSQIEVFPNPTAESVNITINKNADDLELELMDFSGKVLVRKSAEAFMTLDLKGFSKGAYVLSLRNKKQIVYISQIIKQ